MTVWRMRIACWIPKATYVHLEYVIHRVLHCNNICNNTPYWYVICALSVLFQYNIPLRPHCHDTEENQKKKPSHKKFE